LISLTRVGHIIVGPWLAFGGGVGITVIAALVAPAGAQGERPRFAPEKIIVRFDPEGDLDTRDLHQLAALLVDGELTHQSRLIPGFAVLRVRRGLEDDAILRVRELPQLLYATRDQVGELASPPNDPWFSQQWQFQNTGQIVNNYTGAKGKAGVDICAVPAWSIRNDASPTIVAVIDTGVQYLHPELAPNMWKNLNEVAGNGLDDDGNGYIDDIHGIRIDGCDAYFGKGDPYEPSATLPDPSYGGSHGTAAAAFAAMRGDNNALGTGAAWKARIMGIATLGINAQGTYCTGLSEAGLAVAFEYAAYMGARVVNCSWSFASNTVALYDVFQSGSEAGLLFVVAAQNYNYNLDAPIPAGCPPLVPQGNWPANYSLDSILGVGAADELGNRSIWAPGLPGCLGASNWGPLSVDLFAPGSNLRGLPGNEGCIGSNPTQLYCGGTSYAAPIASAVAALVWSQHPTWTNTQVRSHLVSTAMPIPCLTGLCVSGGMINASAALGAVPCQTIGGCYP
jgi:subtilisin family serine protease